MGKETNLNTIMIAVLLGVSGWVAYKTSETGEKVSAITATMTGASEKQATTDREVLELRTRVARLEIEFAAFQARNVAR